MGPVPGQCVVPEPQDSTWGNQGEEAGRIFGTGGEFMNDLPFVGQKRVTDTVLGEVPVIIPVFKPQEGYFGYRAGTGSEEEEAETEQGKEQGYDRHGDMINGKPVMGKVTCEVVGCGIYWRWADISERPGVGVTEKPQASQAGGAVRR